MTPRQRRIHIEGLGKAAAAPRKSYLGKFTPLKSVQSAWIKSLLTVWGECVGGKTRAQYRLENFSQFWSEVKQSEWSDTQLSRITEALGQAREEGFRGVQAALRARSILWPVTLSALIEESERRDDADFIEQIMLNTFDLHDPVYLVGRQFYTTRKKMSDITRELQHVAPWLTDGEARKRVRWCLEIFQAKVFLTVCRQMKTEQN
ncbi:hypothetical protein G7090_09045 [Leclercia sp. 29361]|jgi:hypothetical protein|uniref:hypothetical protein n=1 Tax=Leclercia TaxID=83654 RepID=UPI000D131C7E|nr:MULTISPECIES: hypothetical protein [Leclercia]MCT9843316.1 hypothetical protein [Leclercia adecarboxylata ATCC 23216 = NBRC 102595]PSS53662.1 hypothetical protein C6560_04515 [Enterobacter sp. FS01]MCU6683843.1 hypothetical protein [Leclercia tamurae]MDY0920585.1 hypothetical protein [Leclercia sp. CFBP8987]QIK13515.1 hypothetical protein G7090_09045 [Leclercia sp. 29361]